MIVQLFVHGPISPYLLAPPCQVPSEFEVWVRVACMLLSLARALPFSTNLVSNNTQGHPLVTSLNVSKCNSGNACQWLPYLHCKGWPFCLFTLYEVACLQFFTNYTFALGVLTTCRFSDVLSQTLPPSFMKDWLVLVCKYSTEQFDKTKPGRRHLQGLALDTSSIILEIVWLPFLCSLCAHKQRKRALLRRRQSFLHNNRSLQNLIEQRITYDGPFKHCVSTPSSNMTLDSPSTRIWMV